jgi:hypothetical protein
MWEDVGPRIVTRVTFFFVNDGQRWAEAAAVNARHVSVSFNKKYPSTRLAIPASMAENPQRRVLAEIFWAVLVAAAAATCRKHVCIYVYTYTPESM